MISTGRTCGQACLIRSGLHPCAATYAYARCWRVMSPTTSSICKKALEQMNLKLSYGGACVAGVRGAGFRIALLAELFCQPCFVFIIAIGCISGVQAAYDRRISVQLPAYLLDACLGPLSCEIRQHRPRSHQPPLTPNSNKFPFCDSIRVRRQMDQFRKRRPWMRCFYLPPGPNPLVDLLHKTLIT